jgi:hypothetical protein
MYINIVTIYLHEYEEECKFSSPSSDFIGLIRTSVLLNAEVPPETTTF